MRGGVFCLFFCCISALSAHYLINKPCRGWHPRQPAFWTSHLVIYCTNFEKTHKLWQGRALFARFGRLHKFVTIKKNSTIRYRDVGGAVPYILFASSTAAKSLRSLRILPCAGNYKSGAVLVLRYLLCDRRKFDILLFLSAPLSRLAPIEALPQAPLGTLSLDPAMGFTP